MLKNPEEIVTPYVKKLEGIISDIEIRHEEIVRWREGNPEDSPEEKAAWEAKSDLEAAAFKTVLDHYRESLTAEKDGIKRAAKRYDARGSRINPRRIYNRKGTLQTCPLCGSDDLHLEETDQWISCNRCNHF